MSIPKFQWEGFNILKLEYDFQDKSHILLLDYGSPSSGNLFHNLIKVDVTGNLIWRAELIETEAPDFYTSFHLEQWANISAFTSSCYAVEVDRVTGKMISSLFTK